MKRGPPALPEISSPEDFGIAKGLFLLLVFSLPFMNPAIRYPVILTDLLFLVVAAALAVEVVLGRRTLRWRRSYWVLVCYGTCLSVSLLVSPDFGVSLLKSASTFYLVALAMLADQMIESRRDFQAVVIAWIAASAVVAAIGIIALLLFPFTPDAPLLDYARNEYGTLRAGPYTRLKSTFFYASMMCNYLTVSVSLLLLARRCRWIGRPAFIALLAGMLIVGVASVSPGVGGLLLAIGSWLWLTRRASSPRSAGGALTVGVAGAAAFLLAMTLTPIAHATAPFRLTLPGGIELFPAVRFLTWSASLHTWLAQPLLGHGLGVDPIMAAYQDPVGRVRTMTDAHNLFLSVAAQTGVVGLLGLFAVIALAVRLTFRRANWSIGGNWAVAWLGITFLNGFVYQGLGGAFEDTRHLWLLLGLLMAADRLPIGAGERTQAADSVNSR